MTWPLLAAGTALFYAFHGAWSKRVAARTGPLVAAWTVFVSALPLFALYLGWTGSPDLAPGFWVAAGASALLNVAGIGLFFSALSAGELGVTYPLLALTPLFVVPVEWVLLGVLPGIWGAAGVVLVVIGVYLLEFRERKRGLLAPLRALVASTGARRALGVAVIWSVSGTLDRVAVLASSPGFYGVFFAGSLSLLFLPLVVWRVRRSGRGLADRVAAAGVPALGLHGLFFVAMFLLQMEALELALASYVLSIKRTGTLVAVLLGGLVFREGGLRHRLAGTAVVLAGVSVLVLLG